MADRPDFQEKQYAFAHHIRDPKNHPPPAGVEDRRMAIYRELFFNNLRSLLSQTFPVLRKLHEKNKWDSLIRQFMVRHEAKTPYFLRIPEEFVSFLCDEYELQADDFPFLLEMAHYEWVELALSVSNEVNDVGEVDAHGSLLDKVPVISKLAWTFSYHFPVHRISEDFLPASPGEQMTFLTICRKSNEDMDFMELNPVTARLLELIEANDVETGRELLVRLAEELRYPDVDMLVQHGLDAMEDMRNAEIILGVK